MRRHHEEMTLLSQMGPQLAVAVGALGTAASAVLVRIKGKLKG